VQEKFWLTASGSELICAIDYVCKAMFLIEELALCLDLILGRWIGCSVCKSPVQCEAWLCGLVHMSR
jgi:hypothetical protein